MVKTQTKYLDHYVSSSVVNTSLPTSVQFSRSVVYDSL